MPQKTGEGMDSILDPEAGRLGDGAAGTLGLFAPELLPKEGFALSPSCPNQLDATVSVEENGVSAQGRFSVQMFKFAGNYDQVFLHCEVRLCDALQEQCQPVSASLDSCESPAGAWGPTHRYWDIMGGKKEREEGRKGEWEGRREEGGGGKES